jgi:hypothetical protein
MGRSGKEKTYCPMIKTMYEEGYTLQKIAEAVGVSVSEVYNVVTNLGLPKRTPVIDESTLVYADNSLPTLEQVIIYGEWKIKNGIKYREKRICTDVAPYYIPR